MITQQIKRAEREREESERGGERERERRERHVFASMEGIIFSSPPIAKEEKSSIHSFAMESSSES